MKTAIRWSAASKQWRWMLAINFAIAPIALVYTMAAESTRFPAYMHLLVTYHFGFIRRALVGTILSWFTDTVPFWYVYALAATAWIVAVILFIAVFRKVFGFTEKNLPLFVFLVGSPFFFKNFAISYGHFDIYGCLWALVALLIPVGPLYPLVVALGCVGLILMHHLHFLLYIPVIGFIVLVRYAAPAGFSTRKVVYGLALVLLLAATFAAAIAFGRPPVPRETFLAYLGSRASDPIDPSNAWMWYSTLAQEIQSTWERMAFNSTRFPVYAALIALHIPVWSYLRTLIANLPTAFLRAASIAAVVTISVGYLAIGVVAHDYSRWVSNWGVCMFLVLHAVRLLPSTATPSDVPIRPATTTNLVLGWIVTAIPRVGITIPF